MGTVSGWFGSQLARHLASEVHQHGSAPPGHCFVEADVSDGVRTVGAELFEAYHTRICRPVGLGPADVEQVMGYAIARLGHHYDLRNVWDLARYLLPTPPVPNGFGAACCRWAAATRRAPSAPRSSPRRSSPSGTPSCR